MLNIKTFFILLRESFRDLMPIVLVIIFFQGLIIESIPQNWLSTSIGLVVVGIGLAVFLMGLEVGLFPIGEGLASDFAHKGSLKWILIFGFLIGFGTTIAEPALVVIADKAAAISSGRIDAVFLRGVVAVSVGLAIVIGVYRIVKGHPIHYYIIFGYILVVATTAFSPDEIVALAYDLGGVTTSTVTVPLVAALGIGLASTIKGRNPVLDGFGLIAFASLTPMIFVQIYGIYVYNFIDPKDITITTDLAIVSGEITKFDIVEVAKSLIGVLKDVFPIMAIILFFQYGIIKKPIKNLKEIIIGFALVIIGLDMFIVGLDMGLFSLGETMAFELTSKSNFAIVYLFAFAIGFSTTMAEPSLTAIARKAKEISDGRINDFVLRMFVAFGVAIGIALGAFRIISGGEIVYYIIVGYIFVIALTFISPKYIIPIAYDSGGVTTSTVTVPLVAAIGLGLASNTPGRDPLTDGFGLIAFASLFPMITVMSYGVIIERIGVKSEREKELEIKDAIEHVNDISLATVNIDGTLQRHSYKKSFSSVNLIVPVELQEDAIKAGLEAGAMGVTITKAKGFGLNSIENFYNRLQNEHTDVNLMFIVPTNMVEKITQKLVNRFDLTGEGKGIVYSFKLDSIKGISIKSSEI